MHVFFRIIRFNTILIKTSAVANGHSLNSVRINECLIYVKNENIFAVVGQYTIVEIW